MQGSSVVGGDVPLDPPHCSHFARKIPFDTPARRHTPWLYPVLLFTRLLVTFPYRLTISLPGSLSFHFSCHPFLATSTTTYFSGILVSAHTRGHIFLLMQRIPSYNSHFPCSVSIFICPSNFSHHHMNIQQILLSYKNKNPRPPISLQCLPWSSPSIR